MELANGRLTARVDTLGGELVSLRDGDGTEYIWQGDPAFWSGRNPLLFPIVGNLAEDRVTIGGRQYHMKRHGFARRSRFAAVEQEKDRVVLELRESTATLEQYPFPFLLRTEHRVTDTGFVTRMTVENTGTAELPFCLGAHTAFNCPLGPGERFEDYRLVFPQTEQAGTLPLTPVGLLSGGGPLPMLSGGDTIALDREVFRKLDTIILDSHRSRSVRLVHKDTGRGLQVEFPDFPLIAFWTPSGCEAPFVCIEPWQGCAACVGESGRFEDKPYCVQLRPGEKWTAGYEMKIL